MLYHGNIKELDR